jgi:hypothetical protein
MEFGGTVRKTTLHLTTRSILNGVFSVLTSFPGYERRGRRAEARRVFRPGTGPGIRRVPDHADAEAGKQGAASAQLLNLEGEQGRSLVATGGRWH